MFSKDAFDSLPPEARKELASLAEKYKRGEISVPDYKKSCTDIIAEHQEEQFQEEALHGSRRGRPSGKDDQKPEYMSDIIHYAGVNLKEEAQHIAKEAEDSLPLDDTKGKVYDYKNTIESLFDGRIYTYFLEKIGKLRDIGVSDDASLLVFQASKRKILELLEKMIQQSKVRMDISRNDYLIRIENDKRRQMWFLEQEEKLEMDKYRQKKDGDEAEGKKKWRKALQDREDLIIKKRLSNNVALAALGSQPKSWMSAGAQGTDDGSAPYLTLFQGSDERSQKSSTRVIVKEDLLNVLARDKRYNKSIFTIKHTYL
ncbi:uncharacterized protein NEMAJ01_0178 [Nematocida major]|uniref:uncharacterized protein n=1 Tax=Nematocida major TaxID=1912982 RepID=UPI0020080F08|nr:uncharacterized protein NEMAJ01_0178 [Nematocida major]KAH9385282.1 hypothetical protein NEMAJ01_0178 [Nematocida major]